MRSLMAPTKPATADVALFLSDLFYLKHTILRFNKLMMPDIAATPFSCQPDKLPECQSLLHFFDARAFSLHYFPTKFSQIEKV